MFAPKYEKPSDDYYSFGSEVFAAANSCLDNDSIKSFWNGFCCLSSELDIHPCDEMIFKAGEADIPALNGNQ